MMAGPSRISSPGFSVADDASLAVDRDTGRRQRFDHDARLRDRELA